MCTELTSAGLAAAMPGVTSGCCVWAKPQRGVWGVGRDCAAVLCVRAGPSLALELPVPASRAGHGRSGQLRAAFLRPCDGGGITLSSLTYRHGFKGMRIRTRFS